MLGGESEDEGEGVTKTVDVLVTVTVWRPSMVLGDMDCMLEGAAGRASACAVAIQRRTAARKVEKCILNVLCCTRGCVMMEDIGL